MRLMNLICFLLVSVICVQVNIHGQGEGGVFTADRLAALKTGEGGLGNNPSMMNLYSDMRMKLARMGEEIRLSLEDIDGTIYLNEDFKVGTIYDNGVAFKKLHMRYDAYNDEFEIKETAASKEVQALVKNTRLSCSLNGDSFVHTSFHDKDEREKKGYLITIQSGQNYQLYERRIKTFKEGKPAKTSLGTSFPNRFVDSKEYYLATDDGFPKFIRPKKSEVINSFGEKNKRAIKEFIARKRIKVNERKGLIEIVAYGNTLY